MKDLMKQRVKYIIMVAALIALYACEKPETPQVPDPPQQEEPQPVEPPICTYEYDGKEYPVYSVVWSADESQIMVKISPFKEDQPQTTYAVIGINSALAGVEIDVDMAWHNDDYYFIYEDPLMYYSQYRHLQSGVIVVDKNTDGTYKVTADIVLPDGKTFKFKN
jgi:hypothetical protein